jgi:hypothetical protein
MRAFSCYVALVLSGAGCGNLLRSKPNCSDCDLGGGSCSEPYSYECQGTVVIEIAPSCLGIDQPNPQAGETTTVTDCASEGDVCVYGACVHPCVTTADCPSLHSCIRGLCQAFTPGQPCHNLDECIQGYACLPEPPDASDSEAGSAGADASTDAGVPDAGPVDCSEASVCACLVP